MNYFSSNIRYLRKLNKLTQEEMGQKLNKSDTTIGFWENGKRSPTVYDTFQVCDYFKIDFHTLVETDMETKEPNDENEMILLQLYRRLTPDQQNAIIKTMETMVK